MNLKEIANEFRNILEGIQTRTPSHAVVFGVAMMLCARMVCDHLDKKRRESE